MTMKNTLCALVAVAALAVGCAGRSDVPPQPPKMEPESVETIRYDGAGYHAHFGEGGALQYVTPFDISSNEPNHSFCYFPSGQDQYCKGNLNAIPLSAESEAGIRAYARIAKDLKYHLSLDTYDARQAAKKEE